MSELVLLKDLVKDVAESTQNSQTLVETILKDFVAKVSEEVVAGNTVRITGLGQLSAADTAAREGRNPSTGEVLQIEASKRVAFKASKTLKDAVKATV